MVERWFYRFCWGLFGSGIIFTGCKPADEIAQYTVPKGQAITADPQARTLGAVVLREGQAWFFKISGPAERVEKFEQPFEDFLRNVRFGEGAQATPVWKLPAEWQEMVSLDERFATIALEQGAAPTQLAVTSLPLDAQDPDEYLLSNLNRWRGQLSLAPLPHGERDKLWKRIPLAAGGEAFAVSLVGTVSKAPPASGMPAGHPPLATDSPPKKRPVAPTTEPADKPFGYKLPAGWTEGEPTAMSVAAFASGDGDARADITITLARGSLLDNVNRWRGQLQLKPVDETALATMIRSIATSNQKWQLVTVADPSAPQAILGALAEAADGSTWFVKLKGSAAAAEREKAHFEEFVRSLELPGSQEGARDGK